MSVISYAPMKAVAGPLPVGEGWVYEIKWDGMRAVVVNGPAGIRAYSTRGNEATARFPELQALHDRYGELDLVLDGELVAFDDDGLPSFGLMQQRMHLDRAGDIARRAVEIPVVFVIFDLLRVDGTETLPLPLAQRRHLLEELIEPGPQWRLSALHPDGGPELLEAVTERGVEGVVAKRIDSPYRPGTRSPDWVKVKPRRRQELVVGGWLSGEGSRQGRIGALMVGYHDSTGLRLAGRVGSGLTDSEMGALLAQFEETAESPFVDQVPAVRGRTTHFVEPEVVVEVAFGEWTADGVLRHPVYLGRRSDVDPRAVVREPDGRAGDDRS